MISSILGGFLQVCRSFKSFLTTFAVVSASEAVIPIDSSQCCSCFGCSVMSRCPKYILFLRFRSKHFNFWFSQVQSCASVTHTLHTLVVPRLFLHQHTFHFFLTQENPNLHLKSTEHIISLSLSLSPSLYLTHSFDFFVFSHFFSNCFLSFLQRIRFAYERLNMNSKGGPPKCQRMVSLTYPPSLLVKLLG